MLLLPFFFLISCAFAPEKDFTPSSPIVLGKINSEYSSVKLFANASDESDHIHLYLELKKSPNSLVDVEAREIDVNYLKTKPSFKVNRVSQGRYQLEFAHELENLKKVKIRVQGKLLKHQLISFKKPSCSHSKLKLLQKGDHQISMQLVLKNKKGKRVETQTAPEIILEGLGEVSALMMTKQGVWEFTVDILEENQIIYLSVRANGVQMDRLFRYQHIAK